MVRQLLSGHMPLVALPVFSSDNNMLLFSLQLVQCRMPSCNHAVGNGRHTADTSSARDDPVAAQAQDAAKAGSAQPDNIANCSTEEATAASAPDTQPTVPPEEMDALLEVCSPCHDRQRLMVHWPSTLS